MSLTELSDRLPSEAERNPIVRIMDGEAMADSRDVAAFFGKEHKHVLEKIRNMDCSDHFRRSNFRPIEINDLSGAYTSHVMMTKDGFAFVALGFTGGKAATFKERYIAQFNAMDADLRRRPTAPLLPDFADPVAAARAWADEVEAKRIAQAKAAELEAATAEMAPKVEALARISESDGSFCITDAAKTIQVQPKALFKFLRSHGWIYTRTGSSQDVAYQSKLASGLLEHKTTTVTRSDGSEKTVTQVRVTPKGLTRLAQEFPAAVRPA